MSPGHRGNCACLDAYPSTCSVQTRGGYMIPITRKGAVVASASLALCLGAAACSSSSSTSAPSGGGTTSASSPSGTTVSISVAQFDKNFTAMSALKPLASQGKGNVAVSLPDTVTSARYV